MKKRYIAIFIFLLSLSCFAENIELPKQSTDFNTATAKTLLTICTKHFADKTAAVFNMYGISVIKQCNYDKPDSEITHTSAYTVGKGKVKVDGAYREAFIIAVRGTNGAEWYSNFDFAPSRNPNTSFAENFLFSAQDILLDVQNVIERKKTEKKPLVIVCGHSRGAACANILGILLDEVYAPQDVYVYTFACPETVRNVLYDVKNIFNVINPCDIVPRMPLAAWGFSRAGSDVLLTGDDSYAKSLDDAVAALYKLAPDINGYYEVRHSLTNAGISEDGATPYDMMTLLSSILADITSKNIDRSDVESIVPTTLTVTPNESVSKLSLSSVVSSSSDFSNFAYYLQKLSSDDGASAKKLLNEHMPAAYMKLLDEKSN